MNSLTPRSPVIAAEIGLPLPLAFSSEIQASGVESFNLSEKNQAEPPLHPPNHQRPSAVVGSENFIYFVAGQNILGGGSQRGGIGRRARLKIWYS